MKLFSLRETKKLETYSSTASSTCSCSESQSLSYLPHCQPDYSHDTVKKAMRKEQEYLNKGIYLNYSN